MRLILATVCAGALSALTLGTRGDRFTIDGVPRFLMFISYFSGTGALSPASDLPYLKAAGFDGVRIWPNWPEVAPLMRPDGTLDSTALDRLEFGGGGE